MRDFLNKYKDKIILIIGAILICSASFGAGILYTKQGVPKDIKIEETSEKENLNFEIINFENGVLKGKTDPKTTVKTGEDIIKIESDGEFKIPIKNLKTSSNIIAYTNSEKLTFNLAAIIGLVAGVSTETGISSKTVNDDEQEDSVELRKKTSKKSSEESSSKEGKYVASKNGKKYHTSDCSYAQKIKDENKIWFSSKEEAETAGYEPCSRCIVEE